VSAPPLPAVVVVVVAAALYFTFFSFVTPSFFRREL
jgi:hypothetical protein